MIPLFVPSAFNRASLSLLASVVALAAAVPAWADEPPGSVKAAANEPKGPAPPPEQGPKGQPQSVAVDLKRLGTELDLYAAEASRKRLASTLIGLGVGSLMVPTGLLLLRRTDGVSRALVIGMIIGGSAQLVSVPLQFIPTRMDALREKFISRPANVESKATIRQIENEWRDAADSSRQRRKVVGGSLLGVGTLSLGSGLTLLLAREGVLGLSRKHQYVWGGVLMGIGGPVITVGVRSLLEWSMEETCWEAYRTMKSDAGKLGRPRLRPPSVAVLPLPGGALGLATLPF